MSLLDALIYGVRDVLIAGVALNRRSKINLVSGATAVDNPTTGATDVTFTGGSASTGTGLATVVASVPAAALFVTDPFDVVRVNAGATAFEVGPVPIPAAVAIPAMAIDWSLGAVFTKTLAAGADTFTFANQASGMTIIVRVTGAASTLTWPTVRWAAGTPPTQTASGTDVYTFVHDGTSIYGSVVQAMA